VAIPGQKADLMLIHFRPTLEDLHQTQMDIAGLELRDYLEPAGSYVSVVELGLLRDDLEDLRRAGRKRAPAEHAGVRQGAGRGNGAAAERMKGRLTGTIPQRRYVCFYPMNKRGEIKNWYAEGVRCRAEMMREHGVIGRRYGEQVSQIISGSIGFDDWEWGVDLFADDPLVFKKLVYEMRFDEASSWYGEFGPFLVGLQFSASNLGRFLHGQTPSLSR
jgi:chlorite dismutase